MKPKNTKIKKILISVTGITLALLLLIGSNLGLFAQANEAASIAQTSSSTEPEGTPVPAGETEKEVESEPSASVPASSEETESVSQSSESSVISEPTEEPTSSAESAISSDIEEEEEFLTPQTFAGSNFSLDGVILSTNAYPTYLTLDKANGNPTGAPSSLTVTVNVSLTDPNVTNATIKIPNTFYPTAATHPNFDSSYYSKPFFIFESASSDVIDSFTNNGSELEIKLKDNYNAGKQSIVLQYKFNTADYINSKGYGVIPNGTELWDVEPVAYLGNVQQGTASATVKSGTSASLTNTYYASSPADKIYYDGSIGAMTKTYNKNFYQSDLDPSKQSYIYIDVPSGSSLDASGAQQFTNAGYTTKKTGVIVDGASYDRYIRYVTNDASSWTHWQVNSTWGESYNQVSNIGLVPPSSIPVDSTFKVGVGAVVYRLNGTEETSSKYETYTKKEKPDYELTFVPGFYVDDVSVGPKVVIGSGTPSVAIKIGGADFKSAYSPKNTGKKTLTNVKHDFYQDTSLDNPNARINFDTIIFYTFVDTTISTTPDKGQFKVVYEIKSDKGGATRKSETGLLKLTGTQTQNSFNLTPPTLASGEYISKMTVVPMGLSGTAEGELLSGNGYGLSFTGKDWANQKWPNGTQMDSATIPVKGTIYYQYGTAAVQTQENTPGNFYYISNNTTGASVSLKTTTVGSIFPGDTIRYTVNGYNIRNYTLNGWKNPVISLKVPAELELINTSAVLEDSLNAGVTSAVTITHEGTDSAGNNYYKLEAQGFSAGLLNDSLPVFTIPLDFKVASGTKSGKYFLTKAAVSSSDATQFKQNIIPMNTLSASDAALFGFGAGDNYSEVTLSNTYFEVADQNNMVASVHVKGAGTQGEWKTPTGANKTVPASKGDTLQMKVTITNTGNTSFENIRLYNILPYDGFNGSTGSIKFTGIDPLGGGEVVKYTALPQSSLPQYSSSFDLAGATFQNTASWSTVKPANPTAYFVDFGSTKVAPGGSLDVVLNFQVPNDGTKQIAINQFTYSAVETSSKKGTTFTSPQVGFSTETIMLNFVTNKPVDAPSTSVVTDLPEAIISSLGLNDNKIQVPADEPKLTDYTFMGWNTKADNTGDSYKSGDDVSFPLDGSVVSINLYPVWQASYATITFDGNGGTPATTKKIIDFGESLVSAGDAVGNYIPNRTGYNFVEWNTQADGKGTTFTGNEVLTLDIRVYAIWKAQAKTITLDPNYAGAPAATTLTLDYETVITPTIAKAWSVPARAGYTFIGWNTAQLGGGTNLYTTNVTVLNDATYYAQWEKNYTVTFNANTKSTDTNIVLPVPASFTTTVDNAYKVTLPTPPTKDGYTFTGWNSSAAGGGTVLNNGDVVKADNTYYAQWAPIAQQITLHSNYSGGPAAKTVSLDYDSVITSTVAAGWNAPTPAKTKSTFIGWNSQADGKGIDLTNAAASVAVRGSLDFYAQWKETYTVTFDKNNFAATAPSSISSTAVYPNYLATAPTTPPSLAGHGFVEWNTQADGNGTAFDFTKPVTADVVVYAKYSANPQKIYLDNNDNTSAGPQYWGDLAYGVTVNSGNISSWGIPTRTDNKTFTGWNTKANGKGDNPANTAVVIKADTTFYAQWADDYKVTFDKNNTDAGATEASPASAWAKSTSYTVAFPATNPTRTGYTFTGWYKDKNAQVAATIADTYSSNTTLYAGWSADNANIILMNNDGTSAQQTVATKYDTKVVQSAVDGWTVPSYSGHTFVRWDKQTDGNGGSPVNDVVKYTATYYAIWAEDYTVTFDKNTTVSGATEASPKTATAQHPNFKVALPTTEPTRPGYKFDGWYKEAAIPTTKFTGSAAITGNTTFYAKWTPVAQTITLDNNDGNASNNQTKSVNYDVTLDQTTVDSWAPKTYSGHTFLGWSTTSTGAVNSPVGQLVSGPVTYYAIWAEDYTVTFDKNTTASGSKDANPKSTVTTHTLSYLAQIPGTIPVNPGFDFKGWSTSNSTTAAVDFDATTVVTSDTTVYAVWKLRDYTITLDSNDQTTGTMPTVGAYHGEVLNSSSWPIPTYQDHTFKGWNSQADGLGAAPETYTVTSNLTFYAIWAEDYTVTFDKNGGDTEASPKNTIAKYTKTPATSYRVALPTPPTKDGYTFEGWNTVKLGGGTQFDATTVVSGTMTVYAQWAKIHTVTYDADGGTGMIASETTKKVASPDTTVVSLPTQNPEKTGYTFGGWYTAQNGGGTQFLANTTVSADITVYAKWQANPQNIKLHMNDGTTNLYGSIFQLPYDTQLDVPTVNGWGTPSRTKYTFIGWNTKADGTGAAAETIKIQANADFYAQWKEVYTVNFDKNDVGAAYTGVLSQAVTYPSYLATSTPAVGSPNAPTLTGHAFQGWATSPTATTADFTDTTVVNADMTVYAIWKINDYKITLDGNGGTPAAQTKGAAHGDILTSLVVQGWGVPTNPGYTFVEWNSQQSGGGTPAIGETVTHDVAYYAIWQKDYTVTYDADGGTGMQASETTKTVVYPATTVVQLPTIQPEKTGFTFGGWYTAKNGGGTKFDGNTVVSGDITVYAKWEDIFGVLATDFARDILDVPTLLANDANIISAADAYATTQANPSAHGAVVVTKNDIQPQIGTYEVEFASASDATAKKAVKATITSAERSTVASQHVIQANDIYITADQVGTLSDLDYVTLSGADAWTTDFSNTHAAQSDIAVDKSAVLPVAGTYQVEYSYSDAAVKAFVTVTDGDNSHFDNTVKQVIQANDFVKSVTEATGLQPQDYVKNAKAKAWATDGSGKTFTITPNTSTVPAPVTKGSYIITYAADAPGVVSVNGIATFYDRQHGDHDVRKGEAIQADDFTMEKSEVAGLLATPTNAITLSNAEAWTIDLVNPAQHNQPAAVTGADVSKVEAKKGVYPITYSTAKGTNVIAYVSVGDADEVNGDSSAKEMIQANDFTVNGAEVANGITPSGYISKGDASGWSWDENGQINSLDSSISVNSSKMKDTYGTYPVGYALPSGLDVTVNAHVKTADELVVDTDTYNEAIQANHITLQIYQVGGMSQQDYIDEAKAVAWETDAWDINGDNVAVGISTVNSSAVQPAVGVYPVTFETANGTLVTINATVVPNNALTVVFNGNGATTEATPRQLSVEEPATTLGSLPSGNPQRVGHTFTGWNTQADGLGTPFTATSTIVAVNGKMDVYAQWQINQYDVSFDTQSLTPNPPTQRDDFQKLITKPSDPSKKGYSFLAWYTAPVGGSVWDFATDTIPGQDITLYAQYEANKYVVTYDAQNGKPYTYQSVPYDTKVPVIETPFLYGYTFLGWFDTTETAWDFDTLMPDYDITLHAKWERTPYTVTYKNYNETEEISSYTLFAGGQVPSEVAPRIGGHHFAYWEKKGTQSKWSAYNIMPAENVVLIARYDKNIPDEELEKSSSTTKSRTSTAGSSASTAGSSAIIAKNSDTEVSSSSTETEVSEVPSSSAAVESSKLDISSSSVLEVVTVNESNWSILSLILTIVGAVGSVILIIAAISKKRTKTSRVLAIIGAMLGIVGLLVFLLITNFAATSVLINSQTILWALLLVVEIILSVFSFGKKEKEETEEEQM